MSMSLLLQVHATKTESFMVGKSLTDTATLQGKQLYKCLQWKGGGQSSSILKILQGNIKICHRIKFNTVITVT